MGGERWAAGSDGGVLGVTPRRATGVEFSNHKTTHVNVSGTRGTHEASPAGAPAALLAPA